MKPAPFAYVRPASLDDAVAALAGDPGAKVLAGGQSLVPLLSMRLAAPTRLVDINGLAGLDGIEAAGDGVRIGALALVMYAALVGLGIFSFMKVPTGFIPAQDMGYYIVVVQLPDASSFERTDAVVRQVDQIARSIPGIAHTFAISGY